MIRIRGLNYSYGKTKALANINLEIAKESTTAIIGPSGCGKTTLLYLMANLLEDRQNTIEYSEQAQDDFSIILQSYGLFPWKTIEDNIRMGLINKNMTKEAIECSIVDISRELGIGAVLDRYPSQISGGQRQRAAIARSLVSKPSLLLMDEASSALDAMTKESIQELLLSLIKTHPITVVFVTHSIEEAVFLGEKIVVMQEGSIQKIVTNSEMGAHNYRKTPSYYQKCIEVREILEGGKNEIVDAPF